MKFGNSHQWYRRTYWGCSVLRDVSSAVFFLDILCCILHKRVDCEISAAYQPEIQAISFQFEEVRWVAVGEKQHCSEIDRSSEARCYAPVLILRKTL
jgi:hypothetical protein